MRGCFAIAATEQDWPHPLRQWSGLKSLGLVESYRRTNTSARAPGSARVQQRFYLGSLPCAPPPQAAELLQAVRSHWSVENSVHWCLDVAFEEDDCRVRKDQAAQNLVVLRRLWLNLLRQETSDQRGLKARRLRVAWNSDYLLQLLCCQKS